MLESLMQHLEANVPANFIPYEQAVRMKQTLDMIRIKACEMNWTSIIKLAEEGLKK